MVSEFQEQRYRALVVGRGMANHEPAQRTRFADQLWRRHQIAETQSWRERLRQTANVDHTVIVVEAFQRRAGRTGVVELTLVIVFDDHKIRFRGMRQEGMP